MDRREESLKIAELEATIAELRSQNARLKDTIEEYKNKEQTISSAIIASMEHANQLEASKKKILSLDLQRSRLMYLRMEQVINELYLKYPELRRDTKLKDMTEKFKSMVFNDINEKTKDRAFDVKKQAVVDDPIKKLLHNIIVAFDTKKLEEEKTFEDKTLKKEEKTFEPKAYEPPKDVFSEPVSSSGFDFNEALHPTMGLDEILKSFNLGQKKNNK